ncbi:MAG: ROK family protein [Bacillota bacterium]
MKKVIGVDIGGTTSAVLLGTDGGKILDKIKFATGADRGPAFTLGKVYSSIERLLERNQLSPGDMACIGVSCGGPLVSQEGLILSPPNLPGWDNVAIVENLETRFNLDTYLENDANASVLAEWRFGAGQGYNNLIFLTFGTGLGAGLILNGQLYRGTQDLAGEVGHIRLQEDGPRGYGKAGSFEGFCSGGGLVKLARLIIEEKKELGLEAELIWKDSSRLTARDIGLAADSGNQLAREILGVSGKYLGYGLAILVDIFNPELIIIGSIYHRCRQYLEPPARRVLNREALPRAWSQCCLKPSALREEIGDYASLAAALEHL